MTATGKNGELASFSKISQNEAMRNFVPEDGERENKDRWNLMGSFSGYNEVKTALNPLKEK